MTKTTITREAHSWKRRTRPSTNWQPPGGRCATRSPTSTPATPGCPPRRWGEGGELPAKIKELIALAIAVTTECDGCIAFHARGAARCGATAQEVAEALGVAILMNGGPGTVWGPRAYAAFQEFAAGE